jgi:hypothetical protein
MTGYSWESCWEGTSTVERRTFWNYVVAALHNKTHHQESLFSLYILEWMNWDIFKCMEWSWINVWGSCRHLSFACLGADLKIGTPTALGLLEPYFLLLIWRVMEGYPAELQNGHYLPRKVTDSLCMHMQRLSTRIMSMFNRSTLLHDGWNDWNGQWLAHASGYCGDEMSLGTRSKSKSVANGTILGTRRKQKRLRFAPCLQLSQHVCDKLKLWEEEVAWNATAQRRGGRWTESCIPCCTGNGFGTNASTWVCHCMLQVAVTTCLLRVIDSWKQHGQLQIIKHNPQMF